MNCFNWLTVEEMNSPIKQVNTVIIPSNKVDPFFGPLKTQETRKIAIDLGSNEKNCIICKKETITERGLGIIQLERGPELVISGTGLTEGQVRISQKQYQPSICWTCRRRFEEDQEARIKIAPDDDLEYDD